MPNRFDYVLYDDQATSIQVTFKDMFVKIAEEIEHFGAGRAKALALTKLEETYMWIGKAIRDEQIARNDDTDLQEQRGNS